MSYFPQNLQRVTHYLVKDIKNSKILTYLTKYHRVGLFYSQKVVEMNKKQLQ